MPLASPDATRAAASKAVQAEERPNKFDFSVPQKWEGGGGYLYEYTPTGEGEFKGPGTIKVTHPEGQSEVLDVAPALASGGEAVKAIIDEYERGDVPLYGPGETGPEKKSGSPTDWKWRDTQEGLEAKSKALPPNVDPAETKAVLKEFIPEKPAEPGGVGRARMQANLSKDWGQ